MPTSTHSLRSCSNGSSMPEPDREPAGLAGAAVRRLHRARAAAGDDRVAGLRERGADRHARGVVRVVAGRAGAAEDADRARQLGEQPEALDELALDPQHPPRVGVHPVAGAAAVEQPLVGGRALGLRGRLAAAQDDRARGGGWDGARRPSGGAGVGGMVMRCSRTGRRRARPRPAAAGRPGRAPRGCGRAAGRRGRS